MNLTPVTGLTLPDEKYRLTDYDAPIPISWSSNEFAGPVNHFSFKSGIVAVIQSKDSPATASPVGFAPVKVNYLKENY